MDHCFFLDYRLIEYFTILILLLHDYYYDFRRGDSKTIAMSPRAAADDLTDIEALEMMQRGSGGGSGVGASGDGDEGGSGGLTASSSSSKFITRQSEMITAREFARPASPSSVALGGSGGGSEALLEASLTVPQRRQYWGDAPTAEHEVWTVFAKYIEGVVPWCVIFLIFND